MDVIFSVGTASWRGPFPEDDRSAAAEALEQGRVLLFPKLRFDLSEGERHLLDPSVLGGSAKNVSMDPAGQLKHVELGDHDRAMLQNMLRRLAHSATELVDGLFPSYRDHLERARTSFRPVEIAGRRYSVLKDDTRLHVDAFPTTPMRGRRILRLFANINPSEPRLWNVGEPFADMARKLLPRVKAGSPAKNWLLAAVGATKSLRAPYDDLMLGLHDGAKRDTDYQRTCPKVPVEFPAGVVWMCFTDQVMHAVLKGQHALEQTFHLPVEAMVAPERAPLRVLEQMTGRRLV
jgi:3-deoxy-D-manno-oct-2-ulosonic acid (Kdo) hydroxylase